jgi:hypothetical protein
MTNQELIDIAQRTFLANYRQAPIVIRAWRRRSRSKPAG